MQTPPNNIDKDDEISRLRRELAQTKLDLAQAEQASSAATAPSVVSAASPMIDLNNDDEHDPFAVTFHSIVIFGADGNLAMTKTFPALFSLMRQRHIPDDIAMVGYARDAMTDEAFQKKVYRSIYTVKHPQSDRLRFLSRISYCQGQFNDQKAFEALCRTLEAKERAQEDAWLAKQGYGSSTTAPGAAPAAAAAAAATAAGGSSSVLVPEETGREAALGSCAARQAAASPPPPPLAHTFRHVRTFYLAVPPFLYPDIARCCRATGLRRPAATPREERQDRFILEKPFGKDTGSCAALCVSVGEALSESQMYRIDHYLGKELVMNVLVMRFANISFNAIWDRQSIHSVHILCKETVGTAGRGGYFDSYGIIRDVMQNHLLQILALVAMEQPLSLSAAHIRQEKVKLLQAVTPLALDHVLVGQFRAAAPGEVGPGSRPLPGYLDDPTIEDKQSTTETYAAAVLHINNPRWAGVPFILKAGKALEESKVEVRIRFHGVPGALDTFGACSPNELVVRVQPDERIYWKITSKVPGLDFNVETRRMDLLYKDHGYGSGTSTSGGCGGGGGGGGGTSVGSVGNASAQSSSYAMMGAGATRPMFAAATAAAVAAATGTAPLPVVGAPVFGSSSILSGGGGDARSSITNTTTNNNSSCSGGGGGGAVDTELPGAYERLILEVLRGDQTNFVHADELLASWRIFTPALHELKASKVVPEPYPHGSKGPVDAEVRFARRFGFMDGFPAASRPRHQTIAWGAAPQQPAPATNAAAAAAATPTSSSAAATASATAAATGPAPTAR